MTKWVGFTATAMLLASVAHAQVAVDGVWVRATVPQQSGTGAFMQLKSESDMKLVEADSPVAEHVEIHEMAMDNHVMKMRQIPALPLPAGETVELKPGGYHIMLMDLHNQVKEGDVVPLTLTFENADGQRNSLEIEAPVRPLASDAHGHHHGGSHGHGDSHGADEHHAHEAKKR